MKTSSAAAVRRVMVSRVVLRQGVKRQRADEGAYQPGNEQLCRDQSKHGQRGQRDGPQFSVC